MYTPLLRSMLNILYLLPIITFWHTITTEIKKPEFRRVLRVSSFSYFRGAFVVGVVCVVIRVNELMMSFSR